METKGRRQNKKPSVFRHFWAWLTGSRNRNGELVDREIPKQETAQPPVSPQPPETAAERPCSGHLYKLLEENSEPLPAGGFPEDPEGLCVYTYCGVVFPKADIVYHYICTGEDIQVGDRLLVPVWVHGEHKQAVGIVVSVGQYLNRCLPRPLQQTKFVIQKL